MAQDNPKKRTKIKKSPTVNKKFTEVIRIMANTRPISNEEIKKQGKKRQK